MRRWLGPYVWIWISLFFFSAPAEAQKPDEPLWKKALEIHEEAIVVDAHAHAQLFGSPAPYELDLGNKTGNSQIDFVTMRQGGLDGVFMAMPLRGEADREDPSKGILDSVERIRGEMNRYSNLAELALSAPDVRRIHEAGKRAVVLSIEFPSSLEGSIETLVVYYKDGIRSITLAHDRIDRIADSDTDEAGDKGLSEFGREVVREMNRLGMLIDISHASDQIQLDVIKESKAPVAVSHSCVRALHDKPRNIPDPILKAAAEKGGVVAVTFYSGHLSREYAEQQEKADARYEKEKAKLGETFKEDKVLLEKRLRDLASELAPRRVEIDLLIDHIDHAVKVAGIDHVGIGSDFGGSGNPIGLETAEGFPLITYHLLKRGYKEEDIDKILGGNLLRVLEAAQKRVE